MHPRTQPPTVRVQIVSPNTVQEHLKRIFDKTAVRSRHELVMRVFARHYYELGLVVPSQRTDTGYRLYSPEDLERLQLVLFYREFDFRLTDIKDLLVEPTFDRGRALRDQRALLATQADRLGHIVAAVDQAIAAHDKGETMTDEVMFAVFGERQRELQAEAEQRWGETDAYRESRRRTAGYSRQDWEELKAESETIMLRIAEVYQAGGAGLVRVGA